MSTKARFHNALVNFAAHPVGWPLARIAQRISPAISVPGFGIVISDAELSHQILVSDDAFTKNGKGSLSETFTEFFGPHALSNMDGESHARLRTRLNDVTAPAQAVELLKACTAPLDDMCDALSRGETADLVQTMRWMSGRITFDMLGITHNSADERSACLELVALGERITTGLDFRRPSDAALERIRVDCEKLVAYARYGYESADAPPKSFVRRLREIGLTFDEARGVIGLVFLAGTLTTAAAMPRIVALLLDSGQFDSLRTTPQHIPLAIAEGLRYASPVPATMRIAQDDATLAGRRIKSGTRMIVITCNTTRDPKMFADANRFVANRQQPPRARNLWYGAGPHFCLGFAIAQRQLQMVLERLTALDATLRIVKRSAARNVIVPAYRRMEIAFQANTR